MYLDIWGITFHAVIVFGLVKNLLFRSVLGYCVLECIWIPKKSLLNSSFFILQVRDRSVADLSGGELQRFACAMVCIQKADIFMFDEPSSYLDVKQRLNAATAIRNLIEATKYVIVVEHDLAVLGKFWRVF